MGVRCFYIDALRVSSLEAFFPPLKLCICLFLAVPVFMLRLPLVAVSGGHSPCGAWPPPCGGFPCCMGFGVQTQQLWLTGFVALRHVGSSRTRDRTRVSCVGRQILIHCAARESPGSLINLFNKPTSLFRMLKGIARWKGPYYWVESAITHLEIIMLRNKLDETVQDSLLDQPSCVLSHSVVSDSLQPRGL